VHAAVCLPTLPHPERDPVLWFHPSPNGISIGSAAFIGLTLVTYRHTDTQRDRVTDRQTDRQTGYM